MTVLTWGCGADNKKTEKNPQVLDIMSEIKKTMDVSEMTEVKEDKLKKLFDIDPNDIDEYGIYISSSNIEASEVGIIKVKDASAANGIKDKIEKRIQQQSSSFKDYLPDEYELLQNHVLKVKDKYIFYVVSKDADKIENTFDGFFK
jgi:hypothetical protein